MNTYKIKVNKNITESSQIYIISLSLKYHMEYTNQVKNNGNFVFLVISLCFYDLIFNFVYLISYNEKCVFQIVILM